MAKLILSAQNAEGNNPNHALPSLMVEAVIDNTLSQLAVKFDIKKSPNSDLYPNFIQKDPREIEGLQQDFLWEKSCYELFLAFSSEKNSPYVEINFSPKGEVSIYHFDGYRMPKQMPPRRLNLTQTERQSLINFYHKNANRQGDFWQSATLNQQAMQGNLEKNFALINDNYYLVMMIDLGAVSAFLQVKKVDTIWLNPCVVYKDKESEPLAYFTHQHASPPDFHDKKYWLEVGI